MTRVTSLPQGRVAGGFTLLEVMMALAVMTIGSSALIGMQAMTARFNTQSRQTAIATDIAQTWAERIKQDAASWNDIGVPAVTTTWIRDFAVGWNLWMTPLTPLYAAKPLPWRTAAFNRYGLDVDPTDLPNVFYCVAYRFNEVVRAIPQRTPAMRVDIRVYWPREGTATAGVCDPVASLNPVNFRSVGLPIVVRRGVLRQ